MQAAAHLPLQEPAPPRGEHCSGGVLPAQPRQAAPHMRRQRLLLLIGGCDCLPEGSSLSPAVIKLQHYSLSVLQSPNSSSNFAWRLFSLQVGKQHLAGRQLTASNKLASTQEQQKRQKRCQWSRCTPCAGG